MLRLAPDSTIGQGSVRGQVRVRMYAESCIHAEHNVNYASWHGKHIRKLLDRLSESPPTKCRPVACNSGGDVSLPVATTRCGVALARSGHSFQITQIPRRAACSGGLPIGRPSLKWKYDTNRRNR